MKQIQNTSTKFFHTKRTFVSNSSRIAMNLFFGLSISTCLVLLFPKQTFDLNSFYTDIPTEYEHQEDLRSYFKQSYTYLSEGAQMYAFVSKDGKTILKIFKAKHTKPYKFSRWIRHQKKTQKDWEKSRRKWIEKFYHTCSRYTWAYRYLREETGLKALHLRKTKKPLLVTLKSKHTYQFDLSKLPFILQKRALPAPEYFKKYPEKLNSGKKALKALFTSRTKKGYTDIRQSLRTNYGFVGDQPIQIDVGKLEIYLGDETKEIKRLHTRVENWISKL